MLKDGSVFCRLECDCSKSLLPYVNALIQELLRWGAVVPLAVPHKLIQDDEYRGETCDSVEEMIRRLTLA